MTEVIVVSISLIALGAVGGLVYLGAVMLKNDRAEREMLVKMMKSKDLQEFEYITVDANAKPDKGEIAEEDSNLVDLDRMPDLK